MTVPELIDPAPAWWVTSVAASRTDAPAGHDEEQVAGSRGNGGGYARVSFNFSRDRHALVQIQQGSSHPRCPSETTYGGSGLGRMSHFRSGATYIWREVRAEYHLELCGVLPSMQEYPSPPRESGEFREYAPH